MYNSAVFLQYFDKKNKLRIQHFMFSKRLLTKEVEIQESRRFPWVKKLLKYIFRDKLKGIKRFF